MPSTLEILRARLCTLQDSIRDDVLAARRQRSTETLSSVAGQTIADTIYEIDKVSEITILNWFAHHWPANEPIELVMEGIEDRMPVTFPESTPVSATKWKCLIDPIDGTRPIMYDKRSAWSLAGLAPQRGADNTLDDIVVAAMTELPTTKQWRADQISAVKGCGPSGIVSEQVNVLTGQRAPLPLQPSRATDFRHGFSSFCKFFPEGKSLISHIEEDIWGELYGLGRNASPVIFDDQYITTGGQLYEILSGHDRMVADIRPRILAKLGLNGTLVCHPYDICTALITIEAGCIVEDPLGGSVRAPLDTTSPVMWVAYANETLAKIIRPRLRRCLETYC